MPPSAPSSTSNAPSASQCSQWHSQCPQWCSQCLPVLPVAPPVPPSALSGAPSPSQCKPVRPGAGHAARRAAADQQAVAGTADVLLPIGGRADGLHKPHGRTRQSPLPTLMSSLAPLINPFRPLRSQLGSLMRPFPPLMSPFLPPAHSFPPLMSSL